MLPMNEPPKTERCHLAPYFLLKLISYAHIKKKNPLLLDSTFLPVATNRLSIMAVI